MESGSSTGTSSKTRSGPERRIRLTLTRRMSTFSMRCDQRGFSMRCYQRGTGPRFEQFAGAEVGLLHAGRQVVGILRDDVREFVRDHARNGTRHLLPALRGSPAAQLRPQRAGYAIAVDEYERQNLSVDQI